MSICSSHQVAFTTRLSPDAGRTGGLAASPFDDCPCSANKPRPICATSTAPRSTIDSCFPVNRARWCRFGRSLLACLGHREKLNASFVAFFQGGDSTLQPIGSSGVFHIFGRCVGRCVVKVSRGRILGWYLSFKQDRFCL